MPKVKLLQIITKLELGGAQLSTLELIKSLNKANYEIYLMASSEGILVNEALAIPDIKTKLLPCLKRDINIYYDLKALWKIYGFIKLNKIEIVHTHSSKAGILGRWAARLAGVKLIVHSVHGWEFHGFQSKIKKSFYIFLERITAMITDKFITVTNHDIAKGLQYGIGVRRKYSLVRYGIEKERFSVNSNGAFRKKLGIDKGGFVVGMLACFKPQKSPLDFVFVAEKVLRQTSEAKFIMVGDGQLRSKVEALIERFNLKNSFWLLGWQREIPEILSSFDVLVSTSLWEGLPIAFLEAMASGKPIIANDIDGNSEIIKDGLNGFLVNPRDLSALADRIVCLLKNRKLAYQMGEEGKAILDSNFELKNMAECTHSIYSLGLKEKGVN